MIIIGITGSIGMGKSTIAKMLKRLNIPVFDSDKEVKFILENHNKVQKQIFNIWPDVISIDKSEHKINKHLLSEKIFTNSQNRRILEKIIHPRVKERRNLFIKSVSKSFIVALDIPLLYETGVDKFCDAILLAYTSEQIQKERVLKRRGMTEKKLSLIKKAQWDNNKKRKKKPYLVITSYGKVISFIIIIGYLMTIIFKRKILYL